ncbi:MAG: hypothetical protein KDK78_07005 [Chlamydiia bacterium]|nr:hypothetical protein [Chlamydiia bacterium]
MERVGDLSHLPAEQAEQVRQRLTGQLSSILNNGVRECVPHSSPIDCLLPRASGIQRRVHQELAAHFPWVTPVLSESARELLAEGVDVADSDIIDLALRYLKRKLEVVDSNFQVVYNLAVDAPDGGQLFRTILTKLHPCVLFHFQEYVVWRSRTDVALLPHDATIESVWCEQLASYFPDAVPHRLCRPPKYHFLHLFQERIIDLGVQDPLDHATLAIALKFQ